MVASKEVYFIGEFKEANGDTVLRYGQTSSVPYPEANETKRNSEEAPVEKAPVEELSTTEKLQIYLHGKSLTKPKPIQKTKA